MLPPIINKLSAYARRRPRQERRAAKRLTPGAMTPCQIRPSGDAATTAAWIHNLSKNGVGIITPTALPVGTMIEILMVNSAHIFALSSQVKVARCTRVVSGHFLLGGEFTNALQHDELVPFMV
jgi:hypothetical protein